MLLPGIPEYLERVKVGGVGLRMHQWTNRRGGKIQVFTLLQIQSQTPICKSRTTRRVRDTLHGRRVIQYRSRSAAGRPPHVENQHLSSRSCQRRDILVASGTALLLRLGSGRG